MQALTVEILLGHCPDARLLLKAVDIHQHQPRCCMCHLSTATQSSKRHLAGGFSALLAADALQ